MGLATLGFLFRGKARSLLRRLRLLRLLWRVPLEPLALLLKDGHSTPRPLQFLQCLGVEQRPFVVPTLNDVVVLLAASFSGSQHL
jgi:hypothetical protein